MSTTKLFERLCVAGAQARDALIRAAAARWNVDPSACTTQRGFVVNERTHDRLPYGALAEAASKLALDPNPTLRAHRTR